MDTITHTLMGLTLNGTIDKKELSKNLRNSLFFASICGSNIPDLDFLYQFTEKGRIMYQMWHRGLSHSLIMAPFWALLIYFVSMFIWKVKDKKIYIIAFLSVLTHIFFDSLNSWGTGLYEPFSLRRVSFGVISIVDFIILLIMLGGFILTKLKPKTPRHKVYQYVWLIIFFHVFSQFIQGQIILNEVKNSYDQYTLTADFIPGSFTVIGKKGEMVEIYQKSLWKGEKKIATLYSKENIDLEPLFKQNPKAKVLYDWAPFVVVVEEENRIGIYDPRFYRDGKSFLFEYIEK